MRQLILCLLFVSLSTEAQIQEISDGEIRNKFLTVVKDVEVGNLISQTNEFNDCREKNKFDPKNKNSGDLAAATKCFQEKLEGKDPQALKKLAEDLNLQSYGLIKSKNVNEITSYLTKKMIKSLTGKDPDKVTKESLLWKNQKIVDHKVFIDLYTNQLVKISLMEVSRFCFENLRRSKHPIDSKTSFEDHWSGMSLDAVPNLNDIHDQGTGEFFKAASTATDSDPDPAEVYSKLLEGITNGKSINITLYQNFFGYCQKALPLLCDDFKLQSKVSDSGQNQATAVNNPNKMTKGANACLTLDRLRSIRDAMKKTELVAKQFDEMKEDKNKFVLEMLSAPKIYQQGKGEGEESLDELSTNSSTDMLEGASNSGLAKLENKCQVGGQGGSECDDFLVKGAELDKAIRNIDTEMNLKREIELERVRKIKNKREDLENYLTEKGMFDLLGKFKDPNSGIDIEGELKKIFDARKVAEIEALKLKVGKRQMNEDDYNNLSDQSKEQIKLANIKESKEERARMAQVVLFNNIITSQLSLKDKGSKQVIGRNVNAWKKEMQGLSSYAGYDSGDDLFQGLQDSVKDHGSSGGSGSSVVGAEVLDLILGKQP
jgi:hypothetical protein